MQAAERGGRLGPLDAEPLGKAGPLDKPRGGGLHEVRVRGGVERGIGRQAFLGLLAREHGVGEEGAARPAVMLGIGACRIGVADHALACAHLVHLVANLRYGHLRPHLASQGVGELGVPHRALGAACQLKLRAQHDPARRDGPPAPKRAVLHAAAQDRRTVAQAKFRLFVPANGAVGTVEQGRRHQAAANLLPIGAKVLHDRAADLPGDAAEGLDAREAPLHAPAHEVVPDASGIDAHACGLRVLEHLRAAGICRLYRHAVEIVIRGQQVRAFAQHKHLAPARVCLAHARRQALGRVHVPEIGYPAPHAQGREVLK